jgi:gliding motility-associated lipoprotein GldH
MKKLLTIFIASLILSACSPGKIFERHQSIDQHKWARDHVVRFEVEIEDTETPYDFFLAIRHSSHFAFANIKVNFTINFPSGAMRTKDHDLFVRKENGSFIGEGAGDIWDVKFPVQTGMKLSDKGTYTVKVQNIMPLMETADIMQVGLVVKKSKN